MKYYELLTVLPGTLTESDVPERIAQIKTILVENGAIEVRVEDMGKSRLSYPMKHIRYGYYHTLQFQAEPEQMPAIREKLRLLPEVLRALLTGFVPEVRQHTLARHAAMRAYGESTLKREPAREETPLPKEDIVPQALEKPKVTGTPLSIEDIDKKLNELLEEDIKAI